MKVKIVYSDDCPHCVELLNKLEKQNGIPNMEIEFVEIDSEAGANIIKNNSIHSIPVIISENNISCKVEYFGDKVDIICPD
jgi:glutaredoxin